MIRYRRMRVRRGVLVLDDHPISDFGVTHGALPLVRVKGAPRRGQYAVGEEVGVYRFASNVRVVGVMYLCGAALVEHRISPLTAAGIV